MVLKKRDTQAGGKGATPQLLPYSYWNSMLNTRIRGSAPILSATGREWIDTESHPFPYLEGGPMTLRRTRRQSLPEPYASTSLQSDGRPDNEGFISLRSDFYTYPGSFGTHRINGAASIGSSGLPVINDQSASLGPTAWNRFKPGHPLANFGQSLAEMRELPRLFKSAYDLVKLVKDFSFGDLRNWKGWPSQYVGYNFGWTPFLKDLEVLLDVRQRLDVALKQLQRDNGKLVRRRGMILQTTNTTTLFSNTGVSNSSVLRINTPAVVVTGSCTTNRRASSGSTHWFSGAFRYWIPDFGDNLYNPRVVSKLLGLYPTPALLWEVLPWSWLLDWVANVGDNLDNLSGNAAENLVAQYAYVMSHDWCRLETDCSVTSGLFGARPQLSAELLYETKLRRGASPFGFSLSAASFSAKQWSILVSLGLIHLAKPSY